MPNSPTVPAAVPVLLSRFIGRDRELADLGTQFASTRLLTLTGAGGIGKTRLAAELARRVAASADGDVHWIDLAAIGDPALLLPHVALGLGAADRPDLSPLQAITAAIDDRQLLLVLDNCEHLVDACAGFAEAVLTRAPALKIVATSREALGVPGEVAWLVPPLAPGEAAALFEERARAALPTFSSPSGTGSAVDEICRRLDGLPLAIELAAARVRVLSPAQIAERLSDAMSILATGGRTTVPRHRTLRATIDWSFALLTSGEQLLLRRLAVFAGSFTLEAAEAICSGRGLDADAVLDQVAGLVDKSLVVLDGGDATARYRLLETMRQYADELLGASGERELLREAHAHWYIAMVEQVEPRLFGGAGDLALFAELSEESANLRAAGDWAAEAPERSAFAQRLGYALHWFWFAKGRFGEGRRRIDAALAMPQAVDRLVRGRALIASGHMALWQGDMPAVLPAMQEALELLEQTDNQEGIAYALNGVGAAHYLAGDQQAATEALDRAMTLAAAFPDHVLGGVIRYWRGHVAIEMEEFPLAERLLREAEQIGRRGGHAPSIGHPLLVRGRLALRQERWRDALRRFVEALVPLHEAGDRWGIAQALEGTAAAAAELGETGRAVELLGAASTVRDRIASPHLPQEVTLVGRTRATILKADPGAFEAAWLRARQIGIDAAVELARQLAPDTGSFAAMRPVRRPLEAPADLAVQALGPLEIRIRGRAVPSGAWGSARSRELLLYLLVHRRGVTKDQVGLAFWPEASAAQVRNTFHVTLHRLRKALGESAWVVIEQDRYRLDAAVHVEFDAERFEREIGPALRQAHRDDPRAASALAAALTWYRGDFLEDAGAGDWSMETRDRLQRLFVEGCLALSAIHLLEGHPAKTISTCRALLDRDPLHEEGWRRLMTAHARLGERTHALRLHQQLVDRLGTELGTNPDRTTEALADRLRSGLDV